MTVSVKDLFAVMINVMLCLTCTASLNSLPAVMRSEVSNYNLGAMTTSPTEACMIGGLVVNVSGPCIRPGDSVVVLFDEYTVSCKEINQGRAACILPKFHKIGLIQAKISRDGGMSFPFVTTFYLSI